MSRSLDSTKPAVWRGRFERFSQSGLAVAPFCAGEGVSVASFYLWRKRLGVKGCSAPGPVLGRRRRMTDGPVRHRSGPSEGRGIFQPVAVVPAASGMDSAARAVSIQMPCGTRIEIGAAELDALRIVVAEVARAYRGREAGVA